VVEVRSVQAGWLHGVAVHSNSRTTRSAPAKTQIRAPLQAIFQRWRVQADNLRNAVPFTSACQVASGPRCTHAGDGNVHTNLPVNSDDYEMRRVKPRDEAVARIMVLARSLDGVISASTALASPSEFLTDDELRPFAEYKARRWIRKAFQQRQAKLRNGRYNAPAACASGRFDNATRRAFGPDGP
jgi:FAD/FMN-containing dehydrogenase